MNQFKKINNITGWVVFAISAVVYLLTVEPTLSFWDCGEFLASSYKLEVGHPPGAPFFMLVGRFFALFASDTSTVAKMINTMSGLCSAFTILFLFWSITHFGRKMMTKNGVLTTGNLIAVIGSGVVGSLAYTFSDTFWFSAVEAEVYAFSSLFTALVMWAMLKWEDDTSKYSARWVYLIAYLMGLSIGVHLLNLLAIPAIIFIYYFKKYEVTRNGIIKTGLLSIVLLAVVMYGIIPQTLKIGSYVELMFVNGFGMDYNSGLVFYMIALFAGCFYLAYYSLKKKKEILHAIVVGVTLILIGYSSFAVIIVRSLANPPMDENNPDNAFALLSYLNREQYGNRPLVSGQYYSAEPIGIKEGKANYVKSKGKYEKIGNSLSYEYGDNMETLFPRMYSSKPNHIKIYKDWGNIKGRTVTTKGADGKNKKVIVPTFSENLRFFFTYQLGHMYLRYFMWNFSGRQNDEQSHGGILKGNWITGIDFLDAPRIGPQENISESRRNDPSRNKYYMLPFLLGLGGMFFQYKKNNKDFWVITLLFIMTGAAIVVYLNQTPMQPRERDYAYAGSFYAFAIWIGLGVLGLYSLICKVLKERPAAAFAVIISFLGVPALMATENWDDHDRSGRYSALDVAKNYLNSCEKDAILLTVGDNDTFPLWYCQEVEGIRTDVRVLNMMLFNTDWHITQMRKQAYKSAPVAMSVPLEKYGEGVNAEVFISPKVKEYVDVKKLMNFFNSDNPDTKVKLGNGESRDYFPTNMFRIAVDSAAVIRNGTVKPENADQIVKSIDWTINKRSFLKNQAMLIDILAQNNWERPIYFVTGNHDDAMKLEPFFQLEGLAYRLVPIKTPAQNYLNYGRVDTDIMYDNLVNKFTWGRISEPDVHVDAQNKRTFLVTRARNKYVRLANELSKEGKKGKAVEVLDHCKKVIPLNKIPYDLFVIYMVDGYFNANASEKGVELASEIIDYIVDDLDYFLSLNARLQNSIGSEISSSYQNLQELYKISMRYKSKELEEITLPLLQSYSGNLKIK